LGARLGDASNALARFDAAALRHGEAASLALEEDNQAALDVINRALMGVEPSFIDQAGLDGRPWYRHLLVAPTFGYEPEVLPGLSEAVGSRNRTRVAEEERRLAAALDRAARTLAFPITVEGAP
jgi:N-acetylated-alpha-linked acidic dipeptidase